MDWIIFSPNSENRTLKILVWFKFCQLLVLPKIYHKYVSVKVHKSVLFMYSQLYNDYQCRLPTLLVKARTKRQQSTKLYHKVFKRKNLAQNYWDDQSKVERRESEVQCFDQKWTIGKIYLHIIMWAFYSPNCMFVDCWKIIHLKIYLNFNRQIGVLCTNCRKI